MSGGTEACVVVVVVVVVMVVVVFLRGMCSLIWTTLCG